MDAQQQLYGLMALAEDQQREVQSAIEALKAERVTLQREREAFKQTAAAAAAAVIDVRQVAAAAIPGVQKAAESAVGDAVRVSLAGAAQTAANALETASSPILSALTSVVRSGEAAADKLNAATAGFGWRWAIIAGGISAGAIVAVSLAAWGAVWWQRDELDSMKAERQAVAADLAKLQANVAELEKRGGRIVMNDCGGRLCIEASKSQGKDANGNAAALGSWTTKAGAVLVIPKGY